ncbi:ABC transporter ATP-binding protein [Streptosporangium carneum]|uniref:Multidrug ABC transporter ATP-binding protein n=1 Tax=Streptosporangium carneum TaxID=47481 RepID=A0A9W6HYU0_9ACTN|nr:ABC transporter ATP-binding protein [Streptosporangium carneum]GLK08078.1 multidrug ABC transporter ATP-binding protein [Streptosporangium carneum]
MRTPQPADTADTGAADLEHVIEVGGLRQRYGDFEAVRGVSFTVARGEIFALLGTNGAGKTTTMEVLEGFAPATDGTVRVLGLDPVGQRRALRPRVGIMLQEGGFLGDLTVAETVDLWKGLSEDAGRPVTLSGAELPGRLTLMGWTKGADRRTMGVLELVGLESKARTRVKQLSGGQKRRLDLALAVLSAPEVLFLDEPTTGMDPEARRATWKVIEDLRARGTTVLLTTHYLEEAERLADRLAIMHEGRIHTYGTVGEVVAGSGDLVSFRLSGTTRSYDELPILNGAAPALTYAGGGTEVSYTLTGEGADTRAHAALSPLLAWADGNGETLGQLTVRRGTLEDAFMRVLGETP